MNENVQALLDLQDVDGQIRDLEREAKDLPCRIAKESARMKGVNAELAVARNQFDAAQKRIAESEAEAKEAEDRIRELKVQQATSSSNKEFQQLAITIEGLENDIEAALNRGAAVHDELPRLQRKIDEAQARAGLEQGGVDDQCADWKARLEEVNAALAELAAQRAELAAKVPERMRNYYERLRTKRWPAMVQLNHDCVCEGCHLKVPPSTEQMVAHKMDLVACTNCGRMLYREDDGQI